MWRFLALFITSVLLVLGCSFKGITASTISLGLPIDCELGDRCFILQYPDRDSGPSAVDYGCGRMTSDEHKGTDFAISDEGLMNEGVAVIASAPGTVLRVRDGIEDRRITNEQERSAIEGTECGNGVVVDHDNGWETQYCHLRKGTIAVQPGSEVKQGDVLGLVGTSGLSSFPHVHLTVTYEGNVVDPAVGVTQENGCNVKRNPLWSQDLPYKPTGLIRSGIATQPPTLDQLWAGQYHSTELSTQSDALVFWVHAYGVLKGDQESFEIRDPRGTVIVSDKRISDRPNRVAMGFVGKRFEPNTLTPGKWIGIYELRRGDETLISVHRSFDVVAR